MKRFIMIHHSLTKDSGTVSWGAIERFHREVRGWKDIGYHYGVELVGKDWYALIGRGEDLDAAACKENKMNQQALHVCCVGNYDLAPPPQVMVDRLIDRVILPLTRRYLIPTINIVGHRDFATYKTCPGKLFDLALLRAQVSSRRQKW